MDIVVFFNSFFFFWFDVYRSTTPQRLVVSVKSFEKLCAITKKTHLLDFNVQESFVLKIQILFNSFLSIFFLYYLDFNWIKTLASALKNVFTFTNGFLLNQWLCLRKSVNEYHLVCNFFSRFKHSLVFINVNMPVFCWPFYVILIPIKQFIYNIRNIYILFYSIVTEVFFIRSNR